MSKRKAQQNGMAHTASVGAQPAGEDTGPTGTGCCGTSGGAGHGGAAAGIGPGAHAAGVDAELKAANLKHLRRIEGQVRGIAAMIEEDRYCADIIQQCAAVQESLRSVARNLLKNHLSHCVAHAMHGDRSQQAEMVDEVVTLVGKIAR